MQIRTIATQTHGRYLLRDGPAENLLLGFHGYAENAEANFAELQRIPGSERWTLVSVQALNRFYVGRDGNIGGCWMTTQDRELAISDNVAYVRAVVADLPRAANVVCLGFSQGVALAYRAAAALDRVAGIVALAGDVPPDVTGKLPPVLIGRGEGDGWYTDEKLKQDLSFLAGRAAVRSVVFPGNHEWTDAFRASAGEFLESLNV
jgi:dienelactone hydrolase